MAVAYTWLVCIWCLHTVLACLACSFWQDVDHWSASGACTRHSYLDQPWVVVAIYPLLMSLAEVCYYIWKTCSFLCVVTVHDMRGGNVLDKKRQYNTSFLPCKWQLFWWIWFPLILWYLQVCLCQWFTHVAWRQMLWPSFPDKFAPLL